MDQQPSEQNSIGIEDLLNKLKPAYEDEKKTECESCRYNFAGYMNSFRKGSTMLLNLKFTSLPLKSKLLIFARNV